MRARLEVDKSKFPSDHPKPDWLKIRPPQIPQNYEKIKNALKKRHLFTVCEEAHCPNMAECWGGGTATFMLMGDTCTRTCRFCMVKTGFPNLKLDQFEPQKVADAVLEMGIDYVVLTSVARDDLPDGGAEHFAKCIIEIKKGNPNVIIEVLIPDFQGNIESLKKVVNAKPEVIAHNIETIKELQEKVRDHRANYNQSLKVLENVKKINPKIFTKSAIMVGLGETDEEVLQAMDDLKKIDVDFLTIGQYLRPSPIHLEVREYIPPEKFQYYKMMGENMGFKYVASGPFVRSSYRAGEFFVKSLIENNG